MDPLTMLGTGVKILGGIKSLFGKPKQQVTDMSAVRASYEKGGYNPLAGAGAMQTSFGPQFGGVNGFDQIGDALLNETKRKTDLEMAERELAIREAALDRSTQSLGSRTRIGAVASALATDETEGLQFVAAPDKAPRPRPDLYNQGEVVVYGPRNEPIRLPKPYAERLKLTNGDAMIAEDYEAIFGDVGSEVLAIPQLPSFTSSVFGGLNSQTPLTDRVGNDEMNEEEIADHKEYLDQQKMNDETRLYLDKLPSSAGMGIQYDWGW